MEENKDKSLEEQRKELWDSFDAMPEITRLITRDDAPYNNLLDDDYF